MKNIKINSLRNKFSVACLLMAGIALPTQAQVTYSFTNCGATGMNGPSQAQVNSAYASTNLNGLVTSANGVQKFVVPASGIYQIELYGASGGTNTTYSGHGAKVMGNVTLTGGNTLNIVVGQMGSMYATSYSDGGGGGSFVSENSTLLFAAGGGGGAAQVTSTSQDATISQTPANAAPSQFGSQGAGANANGVHFTYGIYTSVAQSFFNGATGQAGGQAGGWPGTNYGEGGFGGGGSSCSCSTGGGGGGGGFIGGGGGGSGYNSGSGGSSYIASAATNTSAAVLTSYGHGTVVVKFLCNVNMTPSKNPICLGESVTLSTNAVSNISWSNGSTASSITVSPTTNTVYTVSGQAASGCTTQIAINVTVNPLPSLSANITPSVLCIGKTATITASGANTYTWANSSVVAPTTTVDPVVTTSYNYSGTNQFGCVNTAAANVIVNTNVMGVTSNTSICAGKSIDLVASGAETYTWSTGSFFKSTPVSPGSNTTYTVSGTDIHNCVISNMVSVNVNPLPNVSISADKNFVCMGESVSLTASGANTYVWNTGGTSAQINATLPLDVTYYYTVTGTDNNGCSKSAVVSVISSQCTGIQEKNTNGLITRVYPNPVKDQITVETSNSDVNTIEVTDVTGRVIFATTSKSAVTTVDMNTFSSGIYYVRVKTSSAADVIKVVKQ